MKKYLQILIILAIVILTASMTVACTSQKEQTPMSDFFSITTDFVITLPQNATDAEQGAALSVQSALEKKGVTVNIQDDSSEAKNEILIGKTSRPASTECVEGLNAGDFTVKASGTTEDGIKITLAASDDDGITLAAFYFTHSLVAKNYAFKQYATDGSTATLPDNITVITQQISINGTGNAIINGSGNISISGDASSIVLTGSVILSNNFSHTYRRSDVAVAGTPLSSFSILVAKEGARADKNIEAAKYGDTVQIFADLLEKATGNAPTLIEDGGRVQPTGNLILFGDTTLKDDDSVYSNRYTPVGSYKVQLKGDKIVLGGHNPCSALAAGEAFINSILNADGKIDELTLSGEKEIVKVGCVGDSITYGTGSDDSSMQSYPVYLQRMLGYDYYVEKYGAPGHSLIETDDTTFLKNAYFEQSVNARLDVVIIMLGTNDCRPQKWADSANKNWRDPQRTTNFLASGQKMIDAYRSANKDIQIILATCPTVPQDKNYGTDWTSRLERYGNPCIKQLSEANNCPLIDIFTYSENHLEMFDGSDGLHCKNEGYAILAQGFYELTKDLLP